MDGNNTPRGMLLVISGPAGVGKGELGKLILARHPEFKFSVSATTRAPRGRERDGMDYFFISDEEFEKTVNAGGFLEHASVHGKRYGTPRAFVEKCLSQGHSVLLDIDIQGGLQVISSMPEDCVSIFILPPSHCELERRLRARATDSACQIELRLKNSVAEIQSYIKYDYAVINDNLEEAYEKINIILSAERQKTRRFEYICDI